MAWWEFLDRPELYTTQGVLLYSGVLSILFLAGGLGLAVLWHRRKEEQKRREREATARSRASGERDREPPAVAKRP